MKSTFPRAMKGIEVLEGGYVNYPRGPGGATNKGITESTYDAYRKFAGAEVVEKYADKVRYDDLPAGIDSITGWVRRRAAGNFESIFLERRIIRPLIRQLAED